MELVNQKLLTLGLVTIGILAWNGGLPQPSRGVMAITKFVYATAAGKPATIANTNKGDVPIGVWHSKVLSDSGFTPAVGDLKVEGRRQKAEVQ